MESARRIIVEGARVELGEPEATWGQRFYSSSQPSRDYGETGVLVAVRITHPWMVRDTVRAVEDLEMMMAVTGTQDRQTALRIRGYNGVIAYYPSGEIVVVAFENGQVKVVLEP